MSTNTKEKPMDGFWEDMYDYSQVEVERLKGTVLGLYDKQAKAELGDLYYEYKDLIIVLELTSILDDLEKPDWDINETPDNKARDISSIYRVLEYYMTRKDYQEFLEGRRDAKTEKGD